MPAEFLFEESAMSPIEGKFPLIFLSGNNFEAGKQHGLKLRRQIETS